MPKQNNFFHFFFHFFIRVHFIPHAAYVAAHTQVYSVVDTFLQTVQLYGHLVMLDEGQQRMIMLSIKGK